MMDRSTTFSPEELPDGSFIVPQRVPPKAQLSINAGEQAVVRPAEYIGSFTVKGTDYKERTEFVHRKLESMRIVTRSKPILMVISLSGVKVCSESGDSVFMAHALKRISYATCTPEYCQFSFLAREPNSHLRSTANSSDSSSTSVQHCHSFITQAPEQAEELNNIIGDAFKMAYALRRRQKTPTFNEVIERQLQQQQQQQQQSHNQMMPYQHQQYQLQLRDFGVIPTKEELGCECGQAHPFPQTQQQPQSHGQAQQQMQSDNLKIYPRQNTSSSLNSETVSHKSNNESTEKPPSYGKSQSKSNEQNQLQQQPQQPSTPSSQQNRQRQQQQHQVHQQQQQQFQQQAHHQQQQAQPQQPPPPPQQPPQSQPQQQPQQQDAVGQGQVSSWGKHNQQTQQQQTPGNKAYGSPVVAFKERMEATPPQPPQSQPPQQQQQTQLPPSSQEYQLQQFTQQPFPRQHTHSQSQDSADDSRRHRPLPPPPSVDSHVVEEPVRQPGRVGVPVMLPEEAPMGPLSTSALQQQPSSQQQHTPPPPIPTRFNSLHKYDQQPTSTVGSGNSGSSGGGGGQRGVGTNSAPSSEEEWLSRVPWYMPSIPREIALELLAQEEEGSFVVRDSASHPGCYALSVKVPVFDNPSRISHYLIQRTQRGVKLKGLEKEWPNLQSLVVHLTVMQEMLPCTLRLPRAAQNPAFRPGVDGMEEEEEEEDEDLDYQRLSDFTSMMAELRQLQQA